MKTCNPAKLIGFKPWGILFLSVKKIYCVARHRARIHSVEYLKDTKGDMYIRVKLRKDYTRILLSELFYTKTPAQREANRRNRVEKHVNKMIKYENG